MQRSVYSNNKQVATYTHRDQCILITSNYAHTQGSVYSNNKQVRTHTGINRLATMHMHTQG